MANAALASRGGGGGGGGGPHHYRVDREKEETETEAAHLLDTDIETGIWALGITDKCISTDVAISPEVDGESLHHDSSQYDFIHIRYRSNKITPKAWRIAFEQTKPGGWIEVVESSHTHTPRPRIKHQLLSAGFVEVEDRTTTSCTPWQRLGIFLKFVLRISGAGDACNERNDGPRVFVIARKPR